MRPRQAVAVELRSDLATSATHIQRRTIDRQKKIEVLSRGAVRWCIRRITHGGVNKNRAELGHVDRARCIGRRSRQANLGGLTDDVAELIDVLVVGAVRVAREIVRVFIQHKAARVATGRSCKVGIDNRVREVGRLVLHLLDHAVGQLRTAHPALAVLEEGEAEWEDSDHSEDPDQEDDQNHQHLHERGCTCSGAHSPILLDLFIHRRCCIHRHASSLDTHCEWESLPRTACRLLYDQCKEGNVP